MAIQTVVLRLNTRDPDAAILRRAAEVLRSGGLVAFPTETVYGLGAVATDPAAVRRIFDAKGRPSTNPLIVHVDGVEMARDCISDWPGAAERLASSFWPGPLTLVLPRSSAIPDVVTAGRGTVGVRMPANEVARRLIETVGRPLAAPSANRSNRVSPTTAEHVLQDLDGRVDMVLDAGPATVGLESTVLDLTREPLLRILRPGPITRQQIDALGGFRWDEEAPETVDDRPAPSPGMSSLHYAPATPTFRVEHEHELTPTAWAGRAALIRFGPVEAGPSELRCPVGGPRLADPSVAAARLYELLRELDGRGLDRIVVVMPPDEPEWAAIRDRLNRAARAWEPGGPR